MNRKFRFISIVLCFIMVATLLCSCAPRPLAQTSLAGKDVGVIKGGSEEYTVDYEEFYVLASGYYAAAKIKYGADTEAINKYVWDSIKQNITTNYAILELCAAEGITYDEGDLRPEVNEAIESVINSGFAGDKDAYYDDQIANGITDHFYRFDKGVNILYSNLATKYQKTGKIPNTDEALLNYIKKNFIHTRHIAVYVDSTDKYDTEYEKALHIQEELNNGKSFDSLFGTIYNENLTPVTYDAPYEGIYFPRGVYDEIYEEAAFALKKTYDYSDIIISQGKSPATEKVVPCFYIIQKLPVTESEIRADFNKLSDDVKNSIVSAAKEEYQAKLSFEPNEYALGLDLANLEAPENGIDYQLVIGICIAIGAVILLIASIFIFRSLRAKRFHKKLEKSKANKEIKNKDSINKELSGKDSKNKDLSGKDSKNKELKNKDSKNKELKNKASKNKNTSSKNSKSKKRKKK